MAKFIKYKHHGRDVWTFKRTKGKHQNYCLCYYCRRFFPKSSLDANCRIADHVYTLNRVFGITTPVFECPEFIEED